MKKLYPKALLTVLENLFRGRDPEPELPWQAADYAWLGIIGAVIVFVFGFLR